MKDISIIITAHHEGKVAHKTMLAIFSCIKKIKDKFSYEIIIHIDKGDADTVKYFEKYKNNEDFIIYKNNFGDPGMSRNFAIQHASGTYISVLDADDLVSDNWLLEALEILNNTKRETIVHPAANLTFEFNNQKHVLWLQQDAFDLMNDTYYLAGFNRWASVAIGKKTTFLNFPYPESNNGFGHEDYWFNTETISAGIRHVVAPATIEFYRRKQESVLTKNNCNNVILKPTKLFQPDNVRKIYKQQNIQKNNYKIKKIDKYINKLRTKISYVYHQNQDIPEYVLNEWRRINQIEPQLYPTGADIANTSFYCSESNQNVGIAFCELASKIRETPDYVFIVPWIIPGGADKLLLNYINAIKEVHPSWRILVVSTLPANNIWQNKIPSDVQYLDFGNITESLNENEKNEVFSLLIGQIGIKRMHIINSDFAYKWVAGHREFVKNNLTIYVSGFSYIYTDQKRDRIFSYFDPNALEINQNIKCIFTDNKNVINEAIERSGFEEEQFRVHYQPYLEKIKRRRMTNCDNKVHILWASRIAATKSPELLCKIAKKLPYDKYSIDVYGKIENVEGYSEHIFDGIKSLQYKGGYDKFSDIPTEKYDIFLYTSNSDGMPNILLEATAAGLPIVTSDVGGINEFIINEKTGILVSSYEEDEYIEKINSLCQDPIKATSLVNAAQNLLENQFSWEKFVESVRKDIK